MIRKGKVAIVSHDAGGAEILSSFVKRYQVPYEASLKGPANEIFQRKIGPLKEISEYQAINNCDWVLTGTGWSTSFEYDAIKIAKEKDKYVVSFIDHWVNFRERFNWHGPEILPNEIWVGDEDALEIASDVLPEAIVKLFPNPFWQDCIELRDESSNFSQPEKKKVLFVSSNIDGIRQNQNDIKFSDREILNKFLSQLEKLNFLEQVNQITVKPHPSEEFSKYINLNARSEVIDFSISNEKDNIELIKSHDFVIGYESMMLVLANLLGKTVINIDMGLQRLKVIPDKFIDHVI